MTIHIDIGGEGRYFDAINVNPRAVTSTTGVDGRPIPNLVQAVGQQLPFASGSVDVVTVENTPLLPGTVDEIARVLAPEGTVRLRHPARYAVTNGAHDAVEAALGPARVVRSSTLVASSQPTVVTVLRRAASLLR